MNHRMSRDELRELDEGLAQITGTTLPDGHGKPAWERDLEQWAAAEEGARPWRAVYNPLEQRGLDASETELVGLYSTRMGESADRATRRVHQLLSEAWQMRGGWETEAARRNRVGLALSAELTRLRAAPSLTVTTGKTTAQEVTRLGEARNRPTKTATKTPIKKTVQINEVVRGGGAK